MVGGGLGLSEVSWRTRLGLVWMVFVTRYRIVLRYKGSLVFEMFMPVVFALLPIVLGVQVAGSPAAAQTNFQASTSTGNYVSYMLIGGGVFYVVSTMMWLVGFWVRREQENGTLESLYLAPAKKSHILLGVSLYSAARVLTGFFLAMVVGGALLGYLAPGSSGPVNTFTGNVGVAMLFLFIGLVPLWGLSFFIGALVLRIKEANSVLNMLQFVVVFLMGSFAPVTLFPPMLRSVALAFPPTWINNGLRASMLDTAYFFGTWYLDLAMVLFFAVFVPYVGYSTFRFTERRMKSNEGLGQF